ncbi:hypothetical protein N7481_004333 [Penicillium waksmanii]|uniref:uncharacterized protein n=1 Tax=Penicillium waksmanii TaxID=69791 RepID=UPI0025476C5E|nr:uncharacterized protein N7481_004333 [Penicillium waksmanii]KAJ5989123.1 hypothetical protein N7481_004333 [Penicillium waksmanii]
MAATPPPPSPSSLRTPAAPRHGSGYDQYEPYPTRCSARIANQRTSRVADKTSEPVCPSSPNKARSKQAVRKCQTLEVDGDEMLSAPGKSSKSYTRKRTGASVPSIAFDDYDLSSRTSHSPNPRSRPTVNQALPTPAKTPSKRKLSSSDISSASRTLFPTQSSARPKKSTPLSLESFEAPASKTIQIYTDSRDKIPKPVTDMETPFNAKIEETVSSGSVEAPKTGKRARKQDKPNDGNVRYKQYDEHDQHGRDDLTDCDDNEFTEDDAIARAGGMTMIFRGKKVFNKFGESSDEGDDLGLFAARPDLLQDADLSGVKSLTRSSIRPRRLFAEAAPKPQAAPQIPIEEEATDDECHAEVEVIHKGSKSPYTPQSPEFPRAPGGNRNLRSAARYGGELDVTPTATALISDNKRKRASPFDHWLRQKPTPDETVSQGTSPTKRELRSGSPEAPAPKKTRSTRAAAESQSA